MNILKDNTEVSILCAGPGLGFYVPGAVLYNNVKKFYKSELIVIESLLPSAEQKKVIDAKKQFHMNFNFALMAQRMTRDISKKLDTSKVESMFQRWIGGPRRFMVFSGFWSPLISHFLNETKIHDYHADFLHVDSAQSSSWKLNCLEHKNITDHWFINYQNKQINYRLNIDHLPQLDYSSRQHKVIVHGGGWGIGTYRQIISELHSTGMNILLLSYYYDELVDCDNCEILLLDPDWYPWKQNCVLFPPILRTSDNNSFIRIENDQFPPIYTEIKSSLAIISKPGGGTLIDSFASATPLVLLDPFGSYEQKNSELWIHLGFGISYETWKNSRYSMHLLKNCHENILQAQQSVPDIWEAINGK
jgi:hypothetical protein